ncbi:MULTISPECIES: ferredoxin [unclassified Streptomyces]|uniref:ferredoxin n=1 Tax=unclassified Streptomyces TaxID=2593676 RepID=UPI00093E450C|nr:ferredoxin [Streptomyces sp. TSRI0107]OKJ75853.1 ferredoxin [Streptomyces sp. TSRI0107]
MKVTVDDSRCCGSGQCVLLAPEVFDQREDDATVVLLDATPPDGLHAAVRDAAAMCPSEVITVDDEA